MTKNQKMIISGLVILVLLAIYIAFDRNSKNEIRGNNSLATSTNSNIETNGSGEYTITQVSTDENKPVANVPVPDLNRPVTFGSSVSFDDATKKIVYDKIVSIQEDLKKDTKNLSKWINLGLYQKMAGDYMGAEMSWKYVSLVAPTDYISRGNLGDLYAYYLKDNGMAEVYFRDAIAKDPKQSYLYIQLATMYRDVFRDSGKAKAIISQGLSKIPGDKSLLEFQTTLN